MHKPKIPSAPKTLTRESRTWWKRLVTMYRIQDEGGLLMLQTAMEAHERMREAQAVLATEGLFSLDKLGGQTAHPACRIERDSRAQFLQAFKLLGLEVGAEEPKQESFYGQPLPRQKGKRS
jgi:P27 family predicted phage terminase small subunit